MSLHRWISLVLLPLLAPACASRREVPWQVLLLETSDRAAAIIVERRVGDCAGPAQGRHALTREQAMSMTPRLDSVELPPGPQAFAAIVVDSECQVIGSGCTDLVLGASSPTIVVRVEAASPVACGALCAGLGLAVCSGGGVDGGTIDAPGLDARVAVADAWAGTDAAAFDAGDAGPPDANLLACRDNATTFEECTACPGLWCDMVCCPPAFECCPEGCRRVCEGGMVPR